MKSISKIAQSIHPSATMAIDSMFKQMRTDGKDVIGFGAGEPDFPTPDHIKNAGIQAICNNDTKYTPSVGTLELRKAICHRLQEDCSLIYSPAQISVSNGAKPCVYVALCTLLNPGDEVILPAPYWVSYVELIRMAGGVPVILNTTEETCFKITAKQLSNAITDKTKCMILNNPSNPTGMLYSREELDILAHICLERDLYIISDEIYYRLVYGNTKFCSVASLGPDVQARTILINGVSKTYAMTGWRIGYAAASPELSKAIGNYLGHCAGSPCAISQKAATAALLESQESVEHMRAAFQARRDFMVERIQQIPNVSCICPDGAFYIMMNVRQLFGRTLFGETIADCDSLAKLLLKYGQVAVVPGTSFGAPDFIRWSYAVSIENIRRGLDRFEQFISNNLPISN